MIDVFSLSICICWNRLHLYAAAIHRRVLRNRSLILTIDLDVERARLILVKQVVEFVVGCAVYGCLVGRYACLVVVAQYSFVVSEIGW